MLTQMFGRIFTALLFLFCVVSAVEATTVTDLKAEFREGQTFITFKEIAGSGIAYSVYRSSSPITSVSSLTPVATLKQGSGAYVNDL